MEALTAMQTLFASVFFASLFGSVHCVGMCGPLMLIATQGPSAAQGVPSRSSATGFLYHGGRAVSYALLGLAAGGVGAGVDWGGALFGFQQVALGLSAAFLIAWGLVQIARAKGWWTPKRSLTQMVHGRGLAQLRQRVLRLPVARRSFGVGLLSGLLPCGWLFAFVAVAAGSGSAIYGAALMLAFWLGSVPLLAVFGSGAKRMLPGLQARFPLAAPLLLIAAGVFVLHNRTAVASPTWQASAESAEPEAQLQHAIENEPSCCAGSEK